MVVKVWQQVQSALVQRQSATPIIIARRWLYADLCMHLGDAFTVSWCMHVKHIHPRTFLCSLRRRTPCRLQLVPSLVTTNNQRGDMSLAVVGAVLLLASLTTATVPERPQSGDLVQMVLGKDEANIRGLQVMSTPMYLLLLQKSRFSL